MAMATARSRPDVFWLRAFLFGASCVAGLLIARKRALRRFHRRILTSKSRDYGRYFGLDIGGSLAKLVYFKPSASHLEDAAASGEAAALTAEGGLRSIEEYLQGLDANDPARTAHREDHLRLEVPELGGTIHFCSFVTAKMEDITDTVRYRFFHRFIKRMRCTGGGAYKYARLFEEKLGIELQKEDEIACLIRGLVFALRHAKNESFTYTGVEIGTHGLGSGTKEIVPRSAELYPFMLVNIGSGVSLLKVSSETEFARVSGTSLGGGTFWGLCRTLSKFRTFDEAMAASVTGDSSTVDMSVGDIYSSVGHEQFELESSTVASSFGKVSMTQDPRHGVHDADVARSLLFLIAQNLGELACLNAQRAGTTRIYFCGSFLRGNEMAGRHLAHAVAFWSKGEMQARFFAHEGFFGALGTLLMQLEQDQEQAIGRSSSSTSNTSPPDQLQPQPHPHPHPPVESAQGSMAS